MCSIAVHLVILLVAALVTLTFGGDGGHGDDGEVEFAVMTSAELAALPQASLDLEAPAAPDVADVALEQVDPLDVTPAASLDTLIDQPVDAELELGGGALESLEGGVEALGGGAIGGGASFFGLEAQGSRFAYLVDRSASMKDADRMARTQRELARSISALPETAEFVIVFYSDGAEPLERPLRWRDASDRRKQAAVRDVQRVTPAGGTQPLPGFDLIYAMPVKPDAIYFMTDGRFSDDVPARVASLNDAARIPIHCVLFGDVAPSRAIRDQVRAMMQRIASESGGQFTHIGDS